MPGTGWHPGNGRLWTPGHHFRFLSTQEPALTAGAGLAGIVLLTAAQQLGWISGLTMSNLPRLRPSMVTYLGIFAIAGWVVHEFSTLFWQALAHLDQARHALQDKVEQQSITKAKFGTGTTTDRPDDHTPMAILIFEIQGWRPLYANQHALIEHEVATIEELSRFTTQQKSPIRNQT